MWNHKAKEIQALRNRLDTAQQELAAVNAFLEPAREIRAEYERRVGSDDDVEADYNAAVQNVRANYTERARQSVIAIIADQVRTEQVARITAEIEEQEGPKLRETEADRFEQTEAENYRKMARAKAQSRIQQVTREKLQAEIDDDEFRKLLQEAHDRERLQFSREEHVKKLQTTARETLRIPIADLYENEPLRIGFCAINRAFGEDGTSFMGGGRNYGGSNPSIIRELRFSVSNPDEGSVLLLNDSWQNGSLLEREKSIPDGSLLTIGMLMDGGQDKKFNPTILKGVPLHIMHGQDVLTVPGLEVSSVFIGPPEKETQLLG